MNLEVNFMSGDKRSSWESTFLDAKQKLCKLCHQKNSDKNLVQGFIFLNRIHFTPTGLSQLYNSCY